MEIAGELPNRRGIAIARTGPCGTRNGLRRDHHFAADVPRGDVADRAGNLAQPLASVDHRRDRPGRHQLAHDDEIGPADVATKIVSSWPTNGETTSGAARPASIVTRNRPARGADDDEASRPASARAASADSEWLQMQSSITS